MISTWTHRHVCISLALVFMLHLAEFVHGSGGVRDDRAIAEVAAGRVETARAAWWGFDPVDATAALQAAFNSRAKRVIVQAMGRPWIVTTIQLPSDKEIVFEADVVVEAKRGEFLGKGDCLFEGRHCKQLIVRGNGATFRMHKSDYHKPPYELAEWRHALSLRGCQDVTIEDLTLTQSGGDGIYLGSGSDRATNRDITIRNVVCDANNRQGISVITAENLLIENCVFRNTRGTAPQAGIDFEPNHAEERLVNCVLRNCRSERNIGHAYHLYLGHLHAESPPVSIRFENCSSSGCERFSAYVGVANRDGKRTVRGSIEYVGCRFEADQGAGVYIRGNEADGCRVRFERCEIIRRDTDESTLAPLTIAAPQRLDVDAGNIEILDCLVRDSIDRQPIAFTGASISVLRNLSGRLTVESPQGKRAFSLDAQQIQEWFPSQAKIASIPRRTFDWRQLTPVSPANVDRTVVTTFRLRQRATLMIWARVGEPVELTARLEPVGRHTPKARAVQIVAPDGSRQEVRAKADNQGVHYRWTPAVDGPHQLRWEGDRRETLRPLRCSEPMAMLGGSLGINMIRPIGTLYFQVPQNTERFALVVEGAGSAETVRAIVYDSSGAVVGQQDDIAAPHVFVFEPGNRMAETWSVELRRATQGVMEDVRLHLVGMPPLFSGAGQQP